MVITDAVYDGTRIALSFSIKTSKENKSEDLTLEHKIKFDGEKANWSSKQDFSKVDNNHFVGVMGIYVI